MERARETRNGGGSVSKFETKKEKATRENRIGKGMDRDKKEEASQRAQGRIERGRHQVSHLQSQGPSPGPSLWLCGYYVQQQQILDAQQLVAAEAFREQQDMFQGYEQQQKHEFLRFNSGYDVGSVSGGGFNNQMSTTAAPTETSPSSALGTLDSPYGQMQPQQAKHHHPHHHQLQAQLMLSPQLPLATRPYGCIT